MIQRKRLDPDVLRLLDEMAAEGGDPIESMTPGDARTMVSARMAAMPGTPDSVAHARDISIPGPGGGIPVRIYTPLNGPEKRPGIVYFHGGGWVVCDRDTHDATCRALTNRSGSVLVSVDYRRAPEHPYPAAVEDSYAAVQWVHQHAADLGTDPQRIVVCGDSAGGNLAAVMALQSRDSAGPPIALQVLVYPVTNLTSFDTESYKEFAEGYYLSKAAMQWFQSHYIARPQDAGNPLASPLFARDLSRLPRALVITAECDVLRDEGEEYANRLRQAGIPVTLTRYDGMIHPFFTLPGKLRRASEAYDQVAAAIREL